MRRIDRALVLQAAPAPTGTAGPPDAAGAAWRRAVGRLVEAEEAEEARRLPYLLVAVPAGGYPGRAGAPDPLERRLLPALAVPVGELRVAAERVLGAARVGERLTRRTAPGAEWRASLAGRPWLTDDGRIDARDRRARAHVGTLPAGAVYTTVVEESPAGVLSLPEATGARDVRLTSAGRRIVDVAAGEGRERLLGLLARHGGDPDRVGHVGVGLNPALRGFLGWPLVDDHVRGAVLVALGENRHLGGRIRSDLNVDRALPRASPAIDDRPIVERGRLVV
jgi:hypothetical protein